MEGESNIVCLHCLFIGWCFNISIPTQCNLNFLFGELSNNFQATVNIRYLISFLCKQGKYTYLPNPIKMQYYLLLSLKKVLSQQYTVILQIKEILKNRIEKEEKALKKIIFLCVSEIHKRAIPCQRSEKKGQRQKVEFFL